MIRYFEVRTPRADFNGQIAGATFRDGRTRVSFDDDPDADTGPGTTIGENAIQPGRAIVLYAQRKEGYAVVELDSLNGQPLTQADAQ